MTIVVILLLAGLLAYIGADTALASMADRRERRTLARFDRERDVRMGRL